MIKAQAGDIYKWRDTNGILHFSNHAPPEHAERYAQEASPSQEAEPAPSQVERWTIDSPEPHAKKPSDSQEFADALDALRRIEAAVRSGVVFEEYSSLVNNARFSLDRLRQLAGRCDDCDKIEDIYGMYESAGQLWAYQLKGMPGAVIELMIEIDEEKFNKYPYRENNKYRWVMGAEDCRNDLWAEAQDRLRYY